MGGQVDANEYQTLSERTMNIDPCKLSNYDIRILNCALGLVGEAGEIADAIKKVAFHGHGFDTDRISEEIGDLMWYVSSLCSLIGVNLGDVIRANVEKLRRRYPAGFNKKDSINRNG